MSNALPTYTAHVAPSEAEVDVVIRKAIPAGIDGPFGGFTLPSGSSMVDVAEGLMVRGYIVASEWAVSVCYDGLRLEATLAH